MTTASGPFHHISHDNNMMVVRYVLSFCVLIAHTATLTHSWLPVPIDSFSAVGCFFTLSGFLLFPSFQNSPTWRHYVGRRARRILPPYIFIVLLCAFTLVAVSTLSWVDYFTDSGFWKYLAANLSFLNFLHPDLPGVFQGDQFYISAVNGSLWTMKGEWACYLSVPFVFHAIRRRPNRSVLILTSVIVLSLICKFSLEAVADMSGRPVFNIIAKQFGNLLIFFYIGALINHCLPLFLKYKWHILAVDAALVAFSGIIPCFHDVLLPFVAGTLVIWFSLVGKWGSRLSRHDNVSYDIYLFHYPIIQLTVLWGLPQNLSPYAVLLIVSAATVALACISWNMVGKHFLRH